MPRPFGRTEGRGLSLSILQSFRQQFKQALDHHAKVALFGLALEIVQSVGGVGNQGIAYSLPTWRG